MEAQKTFKSWHTDIPTLKTYFCQDSHQPYCGPQNFSA